MNDRQLGPETLQGRLRAWWQRSRNSTAIVAPFGLPVSNPQAHTRGIVLLIEKLSANQRDQYKRCGYFDVIGGTTGNRYRVRNGYQMNVEQFDRNGERCERFCFRPKGRLPVGDSMLAQKIALELFECEVLKTANRVPAPPFPF